MYRWRIIVSLLLGCGALGSAFLAGQMPAKYHSSAGFLLLLGMLLILFSMAFAQDDGGAKRK